MILIALVDAEHSPSATAAGEPSPAGAGAANPPATAENGRRLSAAQWRRGKCVWCRTEANPADPIRLSGAPKGQQGRIRGRTNFRRWLPRLFTVLIRCCQGVATVPLPCGYGILLCFQGFARALNIRPSRLRWPRAFFPHPMLLPRQPAALPQPLPAAPLGPGRDAGRPLCLAQ